MDNKKIAITTVLIIVVVIITKATGFLKDIALAYTFGTGSISDAFIMAFTIINILYSVFTSTAFALMPIYKGLTKGKERFLNTMYTVLVSAACMCTIMCIVFGRNIINLVAPGFNTYTVNICAEFFNIMVLSLPTVYIVLIGSQHLRAENSYYIGAWIAIPLNLILSLAFIYNPFKNQIAYISWMYVIGTIIQMLLIIRALKNKNYIYRFCFDIRNESLRKIILLTGPILMGVAIQSINTLVDRMLASGLTEGSMAALNFSNKLALFVISIISLGAGNVCYTKMSELGAAKNYSELTSFLRSIINILNIIVVPATVGMMVLSEPIIKTVFEYGAFDSSSSRMTATALYFYALGLVGYSLRDIITRAFYSLQDSKTPMINGAFSVVLNIVLNLVLVQVMGIGGLALATSISAVFGTILLMFSLRKKLGRIGGREMLSTFIKSCSAAAVMGVCVKFGYGWVYGAIGIVPAALMVCICMGVAVYGVLIMSMRIKEIQFVMEYLKRKGIRVKR